MSLLFLGEKVELSVLKTGDAWGLQAPPPDLTVGRLGLFTRELDDALLNGAIPARLSLKEETYPPHCLMASPIPAFVPEDDLSDAFDIPRGARSFAVTIGFQDRYSYA